ncbi:MAG TPA: hypothetical protein VHD33_07200, partial [Legionellaceae bacterium]|nr:hypothetical protein [Legionellaceae bacterium]
SFFINLPVGAHYNKQSFDDMLTKIHHKLDQILSKSSTDYRYQKIKKVITDLKKELVAAVPKNNNHLSLPKTHEYDIIPAIQVYQFLLDAQIAIQRAKITGVPETHRGLLLGTPVLRELTILGLAIMRFTVFVTFKIARCIQHDNSPVFQNGMYLGLFKPPKTQTAYYLDAFEKALEDNQEMVDLYIGLCENGKIYNYLSFYPKDEYHVEEFLHYSI